MPHFPLHIFNALERRTLLSEYHTIYNGLTEEGLMWVESAGPTSTMLRLNIIDSEGLYKCSFMTFHEFGEWVSREAKNLRDYREKTEDHIYSTATKDL